MVLDAAVTRARGRTRIALPIRVGEEGKPVRIRADLDVLKDVPLTAEPTQIVLAVQVRGVTEHLKGWDIELNPETAFLWETVGLYEAVGFTFDPLSNSRDVVAQRLDQQRQWQGADPDEPSIATQGPPDGTEASDEPDADEPNADGGNDAGDA